MNRSAMSAVKLGFGTGLLVMFAVPVSNLMTAQPVDPGVVGLTTVVNTELQSAESASPVSVLMAGSAVGPSRGVGLSPPNPASAFVP